VVYDYLPTLLDALTAQGLHYSALVTLDTTDVQVPTALGFNIRLTQRNVILAKVGLPADEFAVSNTDGSLFANLASTPILALGTTFVSKRGWVSADVTVNKRAFRLIDTHLETVDATNRQLQAQELLQGPATTSRPVILVGDLNSEPREAAPSAYSTLTGAGFIDTWLQANPSSPLASGWTCCNAEDLLNPSPSFIVRIDHVLTRPNVTVVKSIRVGTDKDNRTPGGLWPSDHAGIVATLAP
jgi:endonuclease/exonuclease/phosphatase family metal-dependent hydrolase